MDIYNIEALMDDLYSGRITRETFRHKMEFLLQVIQKESEEDYKSDCKEEYDRLENENDDLQREISNIQDNYEDLEKENSKLEDENKKFVRFLVRHNLDPKEALHDNQ